jgi:hypothetical protein
MFIKSIVSAAVVSAGLVFASGAADAKTNIDIGIGIGVPAYPGYYEDYPGYGYYYEPRPPVYAYPRRQSLCSAIARNLRNNGYRHVQAQDCSGRRFSYVGWSRGHRYLITVSSRSGQVISRRPI